MSENGHSYCPKVDNIGHKFPNPFNHHPSSFIHLPSSFFLHPSFSNHPTLHPWRASTHPRPPPFPGRAPTDFGPQPSRSQVFLVSPTHQRVGDALLRLARCPLRRYPRGLTRRQPKKSHDSPEGRKLVNHTKTLTEGGLRPVVSWSLS